MRENELPRLREGTDVLCHAAVAACQRTELGNEMRIGQEAHIEERSASSGTPWRKPKLTHDTRMLFSEDFS